MSEFTNTDNIVSDTNESSLTNESSPEPQQCIKQSIIESYLKRDVEFKLSLKDIQDYVCKKLYPDGNELIKNHIIAAINKGIRSELSKSIFISRERHDSKGNCLDSECSAEENISVDESFKGNLDNNLDVKTFKYEQLVDYTTIYEKSKRNQELRYMIYACSTNEEIYNTLDISDLSYLGL
jgi:hypothetical protein